MAFVKYDYESKALYFYFASQRYIRRQSASNLITLCYIKLDNLESATLFDYQDSIPAHFWFNAYIPIPERNDSALMKYGVICKSFFLNDLRRWTNLYAAGRLHKPVNVIKDNPEVSDAMAVNKHHAVCTSLLLLPQRFFILYFMH